MALAALVHAGADLASITEVLASLPVGEFELEREEVEIHGIMATCSITPTFPQSPGARRHASTGGWLEPRQESTARISSW